MATLKIFTCDDHSGYWPAGSASVVVAANAKQARELLVAELQRRKLPHEFATVRQLDTSAPKAVILYNGNY